MSFLRFIEETLGITRLTQPQRVYCRVVFDKTEPGSLDGEDRDLAQQLFGDVETVPPAARHVVATLKGARVGGTWLHSLYLLYAALTQPLEGLAAGEVAFAIVVAPDMRLAKQALRYASGAAESTAAIASCVTTTATESVTLRRPHDGKLVAIECLPATRGGSAVRGRSLVAALLDEAAFFRGDDSAVNLPEVFRAVAPRVLPGGLLAVVSTVWSETDLLWEKVQQNHGNPQTALACIAPTLLMRPDERMAQLIAEERERDSENAAREFDCQPFGAGSGLFFDAHSITAAVDVSLPLVNILPRGPQSKPTWAGMGADTGLVSDSSAAVVVRCIDDVFHVAESVELKPTAGAPLRLSEVCRVYAELMDRHGLRDALADNHELEPSREHLRPLKKRLEAAPGGSQGKLETYNLTLQLLREGKLKIPSGQKRLIRQLREVCKRPLPGGLMKIWTPRRSGNGHGDLVSALVLAVWAAKEAGPGRLPTVWPMHFEERSWLD